MYMRTLRDIETNTRIYLKRQPGHERTAKPRRDPPRRNDAPMALLIFLPKLQALTTFPVLAAAFLHPVAAEKSKMQAGPLGESPRLHYFNLSPYGGLAGRGGAIRFLLLTTGTEWVLDRTAV